MLQNIDKNYINEENSPFLQKLKGQYVFRHFGYIENILSEEYCIDRCEGVFTYTISQGHWSAISQLLQENENCCYLIHSLETHSPYSSTGMVEAMFGEASAGTKGEFLARKNISSTLCTVDNQLRFYDSLIGENVIRVYMSDHGKYGNNPFQTVLLVKGKTIQPKEENRIFSYDNFDKFVEYLLRPEEKRLQKCFSEQGVVEDEDAYGGMRINQFFDNNGRLYFANLLGKRGLVNQLGLYIRRNDGVEQYYRFPNVTQNQIHSRQYADEIHLLREQVISTMPKENKCFFQNTKKLLEAIGRYQMRVEQSKKEVKKLLNGLIALFSDDTTIALRGGGEHTVQLLSLLDDKGRIQYIADRDLNNCTIFQNEYECLVPDELVRKNIDVIIISSFKHRRDMYEELVTTGTTAKIIDIYEYLEEQGLSFRQAFYGDYFLEPEDLEGITFE